MKKPEKLRAFLGDDAIKKKAIDDVKSNREGKRDQYGLLISRHEEYERIGLPGWLASFSDGIEDQLPIDQAPAWRAMLLEAIPVGADLSPVPRILAIAYLERLLGIPGLPNDVAAAIRDAQARHRAGPSSKQGPHKPFSAAIHAARKAHHRAEADLKAAEKRAKWLAWATKVAAELGCYLSDAFPGESAPDRFLHLASEQEARMHSEISALGNRITSAMVALLALEAAAAWSPMGSICIAAKAMDLAGDDNRASRDADELIAVIQDCDAPL